MSRCSSITLALVVLAAGWALAAPVSPVDDLRKKTAAMEVDSWTYKFHGGQRSWAAVSGQSGVAVGLYVFDQYGNCVARDDFGGFVVRDAPAVQWWAPETAKYTIEVHNLGFVSELFDISVK